MLEIKHNDIQRVVRTADSLSGRVERQLLSWICARIPQSITPDHMTSIGVVGALLVAAGYILTNQSLNWLWLANLGLLVNWFGDSLDGTLARWRGTSRDRYGYFIDQALDAVNHTLVVLSIGCTPFVRFDIAAIQLVAYLLVCIVVFLWTAVSREFTVSIGAIGLTELRLILIAANILIACLGIGTVSIGGTTLTYFDLLFIIGAGAMFLVAIGTIFVRSRQLAIEDI